MIILNTHSYSHTLCVYLFSVSFIRQSICLRFVLRLSAIRTVVRANVYTAISVVYTAALDRSMIQANARNLYVVGMSMHCLGPSLSWMPSFIQRCPAVRVPICVQSAFTAFFYSVGPGPFRPGQPCSFYSVIYIYIYIYIYISIDRCNDPV